MRLVFDQLIKISGAFRKIGVEWVVTTFAGRVMGLHYPKTTTVITCIVVIIMLYIGINYLIIL
jgi:hypothetical protein